MTEPPALVSLVEAEKISEELRQQGKTIVFTNGCFDIIHAGHVNSLRFARSHGDVLFVGLNSDESVRRLKGKGRPVVSQYLRAEVLLSIRYVDYVVIFEEDTPENLIKHIKPHILVKGEDWKGKKIAGEDFVKSYGGKVLFAPLTPGISTSQIIKKIRQ